MVTLKLAIAAVEQAPDGIIIVLVQEKMQLPIAEPDMNSDEARMIKKMTTGFRMMGIQVAPMGHDPFCPNNPQFKTGFWMSEEDFEQLGKPTVGDILTFNLELMREPIQAKTKPRKKVESP